MKRTMWGVSSIATILLIAATGDAANVAWSGPGSACSYYSGTASADNIFTRSGGNGRFRNTSASGAKAECPVQYNWNDASALSWLLTGTGSSGWSASTCNLYGESYNTGFAFPTANTTIDTTSHPGFSDIYGYQLSPFTANSLEFICTVPASQAVLDYWVYNN